MLPIQRACLFVVEKYYAEISTKRGKATKAIAQLVERFHGMEEARGSNPLSSTLKFRDVCAAD